MPGKLYEVDETLTSGQLRLDVTISGQRVTALLEFPEGQELAALRALRLFGSEKALTRIAAGLVTDIQNEVPDGE